jgi:hypothetical protein
MIPHRIARLPPRIARDAAPDSRRERRRVHTSDTTCNPSGGSVPSPVPANRSTTIAGASSSAGVIPSRRYRGNSDLIERGLSRLDWLLVRDFAMTETANFWQKGRLVQRGELTPADIGTEVFFLPSASPRSTSDAPARRTRPRTPPADTHSPTPTFACRPASTGSTLRLAKSRRGDIG